MRISLVDGTGVRILLVDDSLTILHGTERSLKTKVDNNATTTPIALYHTTHTTHHLLDMTLSMNTTHTCTAPNDP